jgi:hypothetical protein
MNPKDCPRWDVCSAALCPLDADWRIRGRDPEAVCYWLRLSVKADGRAKVPPGILPACDAMAADPELPAYVQGCLAVSAKSGLRGGHLLGAARGRRRIAFAAS